VVMIPLNTVIASRINSATSSMMKYKDSRTLILSEAIRGIRSLKLVGLEQPFFQLSKDERSKELKYLAIRKYLDAACVFLWAATPVIVPFATFSTTALLGKRLSAADVFTTLSLLNMLIFPMNAFPWVINGAIEARVSLLRLASVFAAKGPGDDAAKPDSATGPKTKRKKAMMRMMRKMKPEYSVHIVFDATIEGGGDGDGEPSSALIFGGSSSRENRSNSSSAVIGASSVNSSLIIRKQHQQMATTLLSCSNCVWLCGKNYVRSEDTEGTIQQILKDHRTTDQLNESKKESVTFTEDGEMVIDFTQSSSLSASFASASAGSNTSHAGSSSWTANPLTSKSTPVAVRRASGGQNVAAVTVNEDDEDNEVSVDWVSNPMTPSVSSSTKRKSFQETMDSAEPAEEEQRLLDDETEASASAAAGAVTPMAAKSASKRSISGSFSAGPVRRPSSINTPSFTSLLSTAAPPIVADQSMDGKFWLGPISITARASELWAVTGAVASGKSTLLLGLLEEVRLIHGKVDWSKASVGRSVPNIDAGRDKIGYCAQTPALHSGTIRDNILMGLPMDIDKYVCTVKCYCC
jgi:ABC-type multidrug transport system fused ATPase/permease subunit